MALNDKILKLYKKGGNNTVKEISRKVNMSETYVHNVIDSYLADLAISKKTKNIKTKESFLDIILKQKRDG